MVISEKHLNGTVLRYPIFACKGSSRKDEVLQTNEIILLFTSKLITGVNNETRELVKMLYMYVLNKISSDISELLVNSLRISSHQFLPAHRGLGG
jgi:hypothetical protein